MSRVIDQWRACRLRFWLALADALEAAWLTAIARAGALTNWGHGAKLGDEVPWPDREQK